MNPTDNKKIEEIKKRGWHITDIINGDWLIAKVKEQDREIMEMRGELGTDLQASLDTSEGLYDEITGLQKEKSILEARLQDAEYRWQCERERKIKLKEVLK